MQLARLDAPRPGPQLVHPMLPRSQFVVGVSYLVGYVLLDWLSYIHPLAVIGITPWNPQTGLSFALLLLFGIKYVPWLFAAQIAADLVVRNLPLPVSAELAVVTITVLGYGLAAAALVFSYRRFDLTLSSRNAIVRLMAAAFISIALVSTGHALVLWLHGLVTSGEVVRAGVLAFVGDLIGVMVFTPFLLIAFTRRQFPRPSWELVALVLIVLLALWVILSMTQPFRFQLFYVFFLPITWIAVRFGLAGATAGLVIMQLGLIAAIELTGQSAEDVVAYQALMVVLAMTGLAIGVLVTEQQRTQNQLRLHQEALNRAARVATMGEFAAAVAHEINQPLTAIGNYARLAKLAGDRVPPDLEAMRKASAEAIAQVDRAGAVVGRLREFIRVGRVETRPVAVSTLTTEALSAFGPELERSNITWLTEIERDLPNVLADVIQVEQVILNLVRNSAEALTDAGRYDGKIVVRAERLPSRMIEISVTDNGPGLDPDIADQPIDAFATTKSDGLGLGLSLSRSIIEAHGGQLRIEGLASGVRASFTLRTANDESASQ
jgi:two-component system, LuxR family, sensor kinase FixL